MHWNYLEGIEKMIKEKSVAFITLGCKVNIAETEGMKRLFEKAGYRIVESNEFADAYVVNTCTVTNMGTANQADAPRFMA